MNLLRTSMLNGIAVVVKTACSLVLNKILAFYVGPAGYAVIGQFQNVVAIIVNLAGGVMATGVTKSTAEHFDDSSRQHTVWRTAMRFSLGASLVAAISLTGLGDPLAQWLLHRADMGGVFVWLALSLPAIAVNTLLLSIVNGKKEVGIYATVNIVGSLFSLTMVGLLAWSFGLYGALVAFCLSPAIVLIATGALVSRRRWFRVQHLWGQIDRASLRGLAGFGLMGLTSALTGPGAFMLIRNHLTTTMGFEAAGYWQASFKISEIYLMLITSTLSVYYLPRLAEIKTHQDLKSEIIKVYRFVMPFVVVAAVTIYILRDLIIHTLFTSDFLPMRELFAWQLTGDVIKIGSWILSFVMLGRAMVKAFILTEIVFSLSFYFITLALVDQIGLVGVAVAYATNYSLYWLTMVLLVGNEMRQMKKIPASATEHTPPQKS